MKYLDKYANLDNCYNCYIHNIKSLLIRVYFLYIFNYHSNHY